MLTNPSVPYDLFISVLISQLLTVGNARLGTFNQEKALAGAFSMIVKTDGSFAALLVVGAQ